MVFIIFGGKSIRQTACQCAFGFHRSARAPPVSTLFWIIRQKSERPAPTSPLVSNFAKSDTESVSMRRFALWNALFAFSAPASNGRSFPKRCSTKAQTPFESSLNPSAKSSKRYRRELHLRSSPLTMIEKANSFLSRKAFTIRRPKRCVFGNRFALFQWMKLESAARVFASQVSD